MQKKIGIKIKKNEDLDIFVVSYFEELKRCLDSLDKTTIEEVINTIVNVYKNDHKIFIIGNGGSASTASHMACDLSKGTLRRVYDKKEKRLRVISLTDNVALMTAFANDLSFEDIFFQQLRNLVEEGDLVIAISGSGNSPNVIKAVKYAKSCGAKTVAFLGFKNGGKLAKLADTSVIIDSNHYGPIEDIQLVLNHLIASWIARVKHVHDGGVSNERNNKATPFR